MTTKFNTNKITKQQQYELIYRIVMGMFETDKAKTEQYMTTNNPDLQNKSPQQVIDEGRGDELLKYLMNLGQM